MRHFDLQVRDILGSASQLVESYNSIVVDGTSMLWLGFSSSRMKRYSSAMRRYVATSWTPINLHIACATSQVTPEATCPLHTNIIYICNNLYLHYKNVITWITCSIMLYIDTYIVSRIYQIRAFCRIALANDRTYSSSVHRTLTRLFCRCQGRGCTLTAQHNKTAWAAW